MKNVYIKIVLFLLLAGLTIGTALHLDRYSEYGPQLLDNANFSADLAHWQTRGPEGAISVDSTGLVKLTSHDARSSVQIFQPLLPAKGISMVRLRALLRCEGVQGGRKSWHMARLILISLDGQGKWIPGFNVSSYLSGTTEWQHYEHVIALSGKTKTLRVATQLNQTEGTLFVKGLSLRAVQENAWYPWLKWTIIMLWGFFLLFVFTPYLTLRHKMWFRILLMASLVAIIAGTTSPQKYIDSLQNDLNSTLNLVKKVDSTSVADQSLLGTIKPPAIKLTKVAHFFLFLLLAMLCYFPQGRRIQPLLLIDLLLLAAATELIQIYVTNRGPAFTDVAIDFAGALLGLSLCRIFFPHINSLEKTALPKKQG